MKMNNSEFKEGDLIAHIPKFYSPSFQKSLLGGIIVKSTNEVFLIDRDIHGNRLLSTNDYIGIKKARARKINLLTKYASMDKDEKVEYVKTIMEQLMTNPVFECVLNEMINETKPE